jgi:CotH protein/lamin tail-like protein
LYLWRIAHALRDILLNRKSTMRSLTIGLLILILFSPELRSQDLYDINTVSKIEIDFNRSDWDQVLDGYYSAGNEERLPATVIVNGVQFDSAGVRFKGNSTYNRQNKKNPFNIKLDYTFNADYQGYGTLKLSNGKMDPSWVREILGYEILRKYMPASRANYAAVYVNGSYHGLYTSTQSVDGAFMQEHYYSSTHERFKCNSDTEFQSNGGTALAYLGDDSSAYYKYYELKSEYGWSELAALVIGLKNEPERLEELVDLDRALWMLAFNNVFVNLDSYTGRGQNYYLYKDNSDRFSTIPWDLNELFGVFSLGGTDVVRFGPLYGQNDHTRPLLRILLSNDRWKRKYMAHSRTLLYENLANDWYYNRSLELHEVCDEYARTDPNALYSYSTMAANLTSTVSGGAGPGRSIKGITEVMAARMAWLEDQAIYKHVAPAVSSIEAHRQDMAVVVTAQVVNADDVFLHYRNSVGLAFHSVKMSDDGQSPDVIAGDGTYSAQIPLNGVRTHYYVYADNQDAGIYNPERAEQEYYEYFELGDVVINEFMASNKSTVADQDGEYEDWIELYNRSNHDVDLTGYFLSDDTDVSTKWVFPQAVIPAMGYLAIWCDNDVEQDGLHASFKLSAAGESISIYTPDTILLDQLVYSVQSSDITTGRYPNGTGSFVSMPPTYVAENRQSVSNTPTVAVINGFALNQNYPNPLSATAGIQTTTITYSLPFACGATVRVYDVFGRNVETLISGRQQSGTHSLTFRRGNLPAGMYIYTLETGSVVLKRKMLLLN